MSDQVLSLHAWMGLLHPVLMILFVYPVVGATIRLGILARERRLQINPIAATVPVEHAQHGAWVTGGVLTSILIALSHSLIPEASSTGPILAAAVAVLACFLRLLKTRQAWQRCLWACGSLAGLLLLGLQPAVERLSDQPWTALFWQSHYWMGLLLCALLLCNLSLQPLIGRQSMVRSLHIGINALIALLLAMQAISGTRNLLLG